MQRSEIQAEHIKSLECAVLLLRRKLGDLREGDWLNLKEELYEFVYGRDLHEYLAKKKSANNSPILLDVDKPTFMEQITPAEIEKIKEGIATYLLRFALDNGQPVVAPSVKTRDAHFIFAAVGSSGPFSMIVHVEDRGLAAQVAVGLHLVGSGIAREQLRICPECQRLFLLKRKPRKDKNFHCSIKNTLADDNFFY